MRAESAGIVLHNGATVLGHLWIDMKHEGGVLPWGAEAQETARRNGWSVISNRYEFVDSEPVVEWDFAGLLVEDGEEDGEDEE